VGKLKQKKRTKRREKEKIPKRETGEKRRRSGNKVSETNERSGIAIKARLTSRGTVNYEVERENSESEQEESEDTDD
jgi:hypothetical protein